jgi:hypothetical protein
LARAERLERPGLLAQPVELVVSAEQQHLELCYQHLAVAVVGPAQSRRLHAAAVVGLVRRRLVHRAQPLLVLVACLALLQQPALLEVQALPAP